MADTLNIFGTQYSNVAGIIASDSNGNELTYTRGGGRSVQEGMRLEQMTVDEWLTHIEAL